MSGSLPDADRFWSRVDRSGGPAVCWPWTGPRRKGKWNYGHFTGGSTHRTAYQLTYGPVSPGVVIRHTCDNPPCCNPVHLLAGTFADNTADMWERGRANPTPTIGDVHWRAVLSDADVTDIRVRYADGASPGALAVAYKVHRGTIAGIVSGRYRRHQDGPIGAREHVSPYGRNITRTKRGKWIVRVSVDGVRQTLGTFITPEAAMSARDTWEVAACSASRS